MSTIGAPISRADGRLKVTGRAVYTADIPLADAAHAVMVHSTIANGRTVSIDTRTAKRAPATAFRYQATFLTCKATTS